MSKKRPGVEAAVRLLQSDDKTRWDTVYSLHSDVLPCIPGLAELESKAQTLRQSLTASTTTNPTKTYITKKELLDIVIPWKFAVGKPRNALLGKLRSNSEDAVKRATQLGIARAKAIPPMQELETNEPTINSNKNVKECMQEAMEAITELQGVGPATASVILSLARPDVFCYMYDEVIDCCCPKRSYTLKVYFECQDKCKAHAMEVLRCSWTPEQVARTLWIAARAEVHGKGAPVPSLQRRLPPPRGIDCTSSPKRKGRRKRPAEEPELSCSTSTTTRNSVDRKSRKRAGVEPLKGATLE